MTDGTMPVDFNLSANTFVAIFAEEGERGASDDRLSPLRTGRKYQKLCPQRVEKGARSRWRQIGLASI